MKIYVPLDSAAVALGADEIAAAIGARGILVTGRAGQAVPAGAPAQVRSLAAAADLILQETHVRPH